MLTLGPGLRWIVEQCRAERDDADFVRFCFGEEVDLDDLARVVPKAVHDDLHTEGLLEQRPAGLRLAVSCQSINGVVSIMPASQAHDADYVHLNVDTLWLLKLVWRLVMPGGRAAELGAGNGLVAAYLIARFHHVVANDIHGPSLWHTQLTLAANRVRGRDSSVVCADIAAGLRPGMFDLVVANPPWSPAFPRDDRGRVVTFADGGPTGTEVPSLFLDQASTLLAPGGTAVVLALDPVYEDGGRPLHETLLRIEGRGFGVEVIESEVLAPDRILAGLSKRIGGLTQARHIAVVIRNHADTER